MAVGKYMIGRYIGLEENGDLLKVQEVREMPAACVLLDAYRRIESCCLSAEEIREKMHIEQLWVKEAVEGRWYGSLRTASQAFIQSMAQKVDGEITYEISFRNFQQTSLKANIPLYICNRSKYENPLLE